MSPILTDAWHLKGRRCRHGGALLAVLWLTAALSAIAFSVATSVRGETERTATSLEGVRAYYLAAGAIERGLLYMEWGGNLGAQENAPRYWDPGTPVLHLPFPTGDAVVQVIPESARLNVNNAPPEELFRLLVALGVEIERAREIALAILDWRSGAPEGLPTAFDQHYLSLTPSFRARHASFEQVEELLLVKGMTPELFHGGYEPDPQGRLVPRGALKDCVTVFGSGSQIDVNTAEPAVLEAIGLSRDAALAIVEARRRLPFRSPEQLQPFLQGFGNAAGRLGIGGNTIYTLRATARIRRADGSLSDQRRSVAATVKLAPRGFSEPYHVLRWHDTVWVQ